MKKTIILTLTLSALFAGRSAWAADNGAVASLSIPSDPVSMTMGRTSSFGNYAFAADNNMAAVALMGRTLDAGVSYASWNVFSDARHIPMAGAAFRSGRWGFAVSAGGHVYGTPFSIFDDAGTESGTFRPVDGHVTVGAAYKLGLGLAVGVSVKGVQSSILPDHKATAFAGDIYAAWQAGGLLTATVGLCNLGTPVQYGSASASSRLPMHAKAGVNFRPIGGLQLAVEGDYLLNSGGVALNAAAQYTVLRIATFRAGYHYSVDENAALPSYASAGVGFRLFGIELNGTYLFASDVLKDTFSVGINFSF